MKFGIRVPNSGPLANRANIILAAEEAERLGFHSIWVHDHILWGSEQHKTHLSAGSSEALEESQRPNFYESITTLSYLAARTQKLRIGIAVLVLPLRNAVVAAKQLSNLDILSEGRLILGVAPGAPKITQSEFEAVGVTYEERGKITDEYIRAMRKIWSENLPSFEGNYVSFKEAQMFPKPLRSGIPILIGGGERGISPRALRRVIELGDGWIPAYLTSEEISEGLSKIRQAATAMGKNPDDFIIAHEMFTMVNDDSKEAFKMASKSLSANFSSPEEGFKRSLIGNPDQITQKLMLYQNAGVNYTELKFVYPNIDALIQMMRVFRDKVMPSFK